MINRTIAPEFHIPSTVDIKHAEMQSLDNGVPVFMVNAGQQDVIRLEFIFDAGSYYETTVGEAYFTVKMLAEGTAKRTASEIEELIAAHGAFIDLNSGPDRSSIELYTLNKHLPALLPLIHELLTSPSFEDNSLEKLLNITLQNIKVNLEKTAFLATRTFKSSVFGLDHPYGRSMTEENLRLINTQTLKEFFKNNYKENNYIIVASGAIQDDLTHNLNKFFGTTPKGAKKDPKQASEFPFKPKQVVIEKPESLQSSIRIGNPAIPFNHPDYFKFNLTLEIFGGYFGSRLMKNIREDKGFTYGIYSSHIVMQKAAFMVIGTDVKKENTRQTLEEIKKEIKTLQTELVGDEELLTVKNYLTGTFLNSINTPFALADKFKMVYFHDLGYDFYDQHLSSIKSITSEEILETARQYLNPEDLTEVIVGGLE
ncbi:pitrilysin family protein [Cytophagaceae bacterium ABcell3]|nr:pitrilysin family protein [Cytophagaceae bacterium ABcell3]